MAEIPEELREERCRACICEERFIDGFCENRCQGRRAIPDIDKAELGE